MNFPPFLRKTPVLGATILFGSLAACTSPKPNDAPAAPSSTAVAPPAAPPAGQAPAAGGTPAPALASPGKPGAASAPGKSSVLDTQISGLRSQIAARREYNDKLRTYVDGKEKQLTAILSSDRSAGPSAQEFDLRTSIASKLAELDREAPAWQQKIDAHKAVLSKAGDDPHASDLQAQVDQLTELRAELLRQRAKLAALPDKLKQ